MAQRERQLRKFKGTRRLYEKMGDNRREEKEIARIKK